MVVVMQPMAIMAVVTASVHHCGMVTSTSVLSVQISLSLPWGSDRVDICFPVDSANPRALARIAPLVAVGVVQRLGDIGSLRR
jgi:hypothetical protein